MVMMILPGFALIQTESRSFIIIKHNLAFPLDFVFYSSYKFSPPTFSQSLPFKQKISILSLSTHMEMDSGIRELVASSSLSNCRRFHASSIGGGSGDVKALVVDDNRINQMLHHKLLDNLGIENQVVGNGKEAVDIHVLGKQFDLILMDIDMPVMNGIEATRKLRDMGIRSIITGVSSHTLDHVKQEFMAAGIDEYHEKPLTSAKLLSILNKMKHKD